MARARNIKPGFFMNEVLSELPFETRLLFIGLWTLADREGRLENRPRRIKMQIFPMDDALPIEPMIQSLADAGFVELYQVEGKNYCQIQNFLKHQTPHHKEVKSEIPPPAGRPSVTRHPYDVSKDRRAAVFERDGNACLACGATHSLSLDHIVPLSKGGDNSDDNLQTLCHSCNSSKGDSTKSYRKDINVATTSRGRSKHDSSLTQEKSIIDARCPSDSLIPDSLNLIPDSLNPSTPTEGGRPPLEKPELWAVIKAQLVAKGVAKSAAGGFIKNLMDKFGEAVTMEAMQSAARDPPRDITEYLPATCQHLAGIRRPLNKQEALEKHNRAIADEWATGDSNAAA